MDVTRERATVEVIDADLPLVSTVLYFDSNRGFGKLRSEDSTEDVFFHVSGYRHAVAVSELFTISLVAPKPERVRTVVQTTVRETTRIVLRKWPVPGDKIAYKPGLNARQSGTVAVLWTWADELEAARLKVTTAAEELNDMLGSMPLLQLRQVTVTEELLFEGNDVVALKEHLKTWRAPDDSCHLKVYRKTADGWSPADPAYL